MGNTIKVLLADDHLVVRMGIAAIISFEKDLLVIGETDNGIDAVRLARELKPDVIVMDLMMPRMSGADATVEILKENPAAKVLALTTFGTSQEIRKILDAGAAGALVKTSSQTEIIDASPPGGKSSARRYPIPSRAHPMRQSFQAVRSK